MKELTLIICLCVATLIIGGVWLLVNYLMHRIKTKVSFKNSIDKSDLVIIPLENNGKKLNFVVDSGSTCNVIDKSIVKELSIIKEDVDISKIESYSVSGTMETSGVISMKLENEQEIFFETFYIMDVANSFSWGEQEYGEKIHGILGIDFLTHYGKVLDFDNCIIYSK